MKDIDWDKLKAELLQAVVSANGDLIRLKKLAMSIICRAGFPKWQARNHVESALRVFSMRTHGQ